MTIETAIHELREARKANLRVFVRLAALVPASDPAAAQFVPRDPDASDTTVEIIAAAIRGDAARAALLLREVATNDRRVIEVTQTLINAVTRVTGDKA